MDSPCLLLLVCQPLTLCCPDSGDLCTAIQDDFQPYCSLPSNKQPSSDSVPEPFADIFPLAGLDHSLEDYFTPTKAAEMHLQHHSFAFLPEAVEFWLMRRWCGPSLCVVSSSDAHL